MKIAGINIPAKLEFGNEEHIRMRQTIESRLNLLDKGIKCYVCGSKAKGHANYDKGFIKWQCACGEAFQTDLDGDDGFH